MCTHIRIHIPLFAFHVTNTLEHVRKCIVYKHRQLIAFSHSDLSAFSDRSTERIYESIDRDIGCVRSNRDNRPQLGETVRV